MEISSTQSPSRISSPNLTDVIKNILIPAVDSVGWNKNILTSVRLGDQREHFYLYLEGTNKNINFFKTRSLMNLYESLEKNVEVVWKNEGHTSSAQLP